MENLSFVRYMRMDRVSNDCIRELVGVMKGVNEKIDESVI